MLPFELLKQDPAGFLTLVGQNTGLPAFTMDTTQVNSSLQEGEAESYRRLSKIIYTVVQVLPYSLRRLIYGLYVYLLYSRKLHGFLRLFRSRNRPLEVNRTVLQTFEGKATVLADENLYTPYRKEYLI